MLYLQKFFPLIFKAHVHEQGNPVNEIKHNAQPFLILIGLEFENSLLAH